MIRKKIFLPLILGVLLSILLSPAMGIATSGGNGQVTVKGGITFYEETVASSSESSTSESIPQTSESQVPISTVPSGKQPQGEGKLPNTGERVSKMSFLGAGLLFILLILLWWKKKKEDA